MGRWDADDEPMAEGEGKAERIKAELAQLDVQRREVDDRLRAMELDRRGGRGGGRGAGRNGGRGMRDAPFALGFSGRPTNPALLRERSGATSRGLSPSRWLPWLLCSPKTEGIQMSLIQEV